MPAGSVKDEEGTKEEEAIPVLESEKALSVKADENEDEHLTFEVLTPN